MSSANTDNFSSTFLIWMPFMFSLPNYSGCDFMLNKSDKVIHTCIIPDFMVRMFSFSLLSMMWAVGLSCMAFIMLSYISSIPNLLRVFFFLSWMNAEFCQILLLYLLRWSYGFYTSFCYCSVLYSFVCVELSLHLRGRPHFILVYDTLIYCWI